jgi:hypothetical protein
MLTLALDKAISMPSSGNQRAMKCTGVRGEVTMATFVGKTLRKMRIAMASLEIPVSACDLNTVRLDWVMTDDRCS